jgi:hypothetical protein
VTSVAILSWPFQRGYQAVICHSWSAGIPVRVSIEGVVWASLPPSTWEAKASFSIII